MSPGKVQLQAASGSAITRELLELESGEQRMDLTLVLRPARAAIDAPPAPDAVQ